MKPLSAVINSVEKLGYRVTVGDVAAKAGLEINLAQQELLALAADTGGHLQVANTGEIVYLFPRNLRGILRNKYWQLRWQQWWGKVWRVLFYLIRISFGIALILSILLMLAAIIVIIVGLSASSNRDDNSGSSSSRSSSSSGGLGGMVFVPRFWFSPYSFRVFNWDYGYSTPQRRPVTENNQMSFIESIFSFLFGDGNPNSGLDEERWQTIGTVIRNNQGAIVAEQIAPYLDNVTNTDDEGYILPVLTRFNGYPEVSDSGDIIYYFPELQVTAKENQRQNILPYLKEKLWKFSQASSGQIMGAIALGSVNFILALVLGYFLQDEYVTELGDFIVFIDSIYGLLWVYAISFLTIPLGRYFWLQGKNRGIQQRNQGRETQANLLTQASDSLRKKIAYARNFASQKVLTDEDITYSTEKDLLTQNLEQADEIDQEWLRRLESN
ncbi:MAG: hypothetical protein EA365_15485 [Gloeocapsa sp. DLM2.Bin57]|nr:MAG: hypothetical protein EA365_15485 [Gloeocapsa sp. DLM2.Bin57]